MENYEILPEILREEPHCRLYRATFIATGESLLIKKVPSNPSFPNGVPSALSREVLVFQKLPDSDYVIQRRRMIRHVEDGSVVFYIVYEYLDTDLAAFIAAAVKPLPADLIRKLLFQVLSGVDYCHDNGIIHRNLNPRTLMLHQEEKRLKIGDQIGQSFGLFEETLEPATFSLSYTPPEILLGFTHYLAPVDIWAVGCIFAELITGEALFVGAGDDPDEADKQQLYEICRQLGKPTLDQWPELDDLPAWKNYLEWEGQKMKSRLYSEGHLPKDLLVATVSLEEDGADLLSKMLTFDPNRRITARAALDHPYFNN